jgi:hypothetical protein
VPCRSSQPNISQYQPSGHPNPLGATGTADTRRETAARGRSDSGGFDRVERFDTQAPRAGVQAGFGSSPANPSTPLLVGADVDHPGCLAARPRAGVEVEDRSQPSDRLLHQLDLDRHPLTIDEPR